MNFGQYFERAITNFGLSLENIHQRHHDWNEESKALGLISDGEKLKMLKRELYCEVLLNNPNQQKILNLTGAIETLEEIKDAEFTRKYSEKAQQLTLPAQLEGLGSLFIMLLFVGIVGSYLATYTCGNSRSQFCSNVRLIPTQIQLFFKD